VADDLAQRTREGIEAFNRGDLDAALRDFADDVVWEVGEALMPDAELYHGHAGVRRFWANWRDLFESFEVEIAECVALDDRRVLARTRSKGVGAGSGISISSPEFVQLFEYGPDGHKVVRVRLASSRAEALGEPDEGR
jgi:ketosteroid isomerase-like protein